MKIYTASIFCSMVFMLLHGTKVQSQTKSQSQTMEAQLTESKLYQADSILKKIDTFSKAAYFDILRYKYFTALNASGNNAPGNYAAYEIADGILSLAMNKVVGKKHVFSLKTESKINNGISSLFKESAVSGNISITLGYNRLLDRHSYLKFGTDDRILLGSKMAMLDHDLLRENLALNMNLKMLNDKIETHRVALNNAKSKHYPQGNKRDTVFELDTLLQRYKLDSLTALEAGFFIKSHEKVKEIKSEQQKLHESMRVIGTACNWISFNFGMNNTSFDYYDGDTFDLKRSIVDKNSFTVKLNFEFNRYVYHRSKANHYFIWGASIGTANNVDDLDEVEVIKQIFPASNLGQDSLNRVYEKKTALAGDFKSNSFSAKFYFDYYLFFPPKWGLHFFPDWTSKFGRNTWNAGLGVLLPFKKDKESTETFIIEFFGKLNNIGDKENSIQEILSRNEFGLRLSVPIKYFNFTK